MTATRLSEYNRRSLESKPVAGADGLRALLKAEFAANNLAPDYLRSWGIPFDRFGVWVSACVKDEAIAILMGDPKGITGGNETFPSQSNGNGHSSHRTIEQPAPVQVPPQATAALSALLAALGGVNPETIKAEIREQMTPAIEDFNRKLETSKAKVDASISGFQQWQRDQEASVDKLRAELLAGKPVTITVVHSTGEKIECGRQHYLFPMLLQIVQTRCHAYLVGPAGSGKTSICHIAANALKLPFYSLSVCQQSTKTDLLGYMSATGIYVSTCFREAFEHGGVFVLDEVDNGNANVIAVLNAALANDSMSFPDGMVKRHPDFVLIAAGNTYGTGADRLYVGRNQLDAATLDRFCFLDFPYDEGFEAELVGVKGKASPACDVLEGGSVTADGWLAFIQKVRKVCDTLKLRHVVSPRATIYGCKLAAAGIGRAWLERMLIWKGLDAETQKKVRAGL